MLVLSILVLASLLMMSGRVPPELVALVALTIVTLLGQLSPNEAFSGFASPTVVMIVGSFFFAGALKRTGIAEQLGIMVARRCEGREHLLVVSIMLLGAATSAFMNNVSAVALLLPSVVTIAAYANISPSLLYLPLSFSVVLGGTLTLLGTPPNLIASDLLVAAGGQPFGLFSITPIGVLIVAAGIGTVALFYRYLLPRHDNVPELDRRDLPSFYRLRDHLCLIRVPPHSRLCGKSLEETHFGEALGAEVVGIVRDGKRRLAPPPQERIRAEDQLVVVADAEEIDTLFQLRGVTIAHPDTQVTGLLTNQLFLVSLEVNPRLLQWGSSLRAMKFKERFGGTVVAIERGPRLLRHYLGSHDLFPGDRLLIVGKKNGLKSVDQMGADLVPQELGEWMLQRVSVVQLPRDSRLAGSSISSARLGELAGVAVIGVLRGNAVSVLPGPEEVLDSSDALVIAGDPERLGWLSMLSELEIAVGTTQSDFESPAVGLAEAIVPPQSKLLGKTLAEIDFREKYDFQVLAVWRGGRSYYQRLGRMRLSLGDAVLLQGPRSKIPVLAKNRDFLVLGSTRPQPLPKGAAWGLVCALAVLIGGSASGFVPPHFAMVMAVLVAVLLGLVSMEDGVRDVDWRIVLFVGALLPFQLAVARSGVFDRIGAELTEVLAGHGVWMMVLVVSVVTSGLAQVIEASVAVLMMTPVALQIATALGVDARVLVLTVACSASVAFLSPTSHRAHILVMSAGGYTWRDVLRLGLPVTIAVLGAILLGALVLF